MPRSGWQAVNFAQLWRYRELLYFLVWRDIKVRYKQTVFGAAWAVIQPVMTMIVFSVFFGRFGGMARHVDVPYPVFVYAALVAWTFFAFAVTNAGMSLIASTNLVGKVYFPRLLIPLAAVGGGLVDAAISCGVLFCLLAFYGVALTPGVLLLPLFALGVAVTAAGVGTLLAALVVAYRDFRYVTGFLVQLWMFASPVAYPLEIVPERWQLVYALNPMVGLIGGFRAAALGDAVRWDCVGVSLLSSLVLLAAGLLYFRRVERRFADII